MRDDIQESSPDDPVMAYTIAQPTPRSPRAIPSLEGDLDETRESRHTSAPLSSRDQVSSTTPDPLSSADDDGSVDGSSPASRSSMASLYDAALMNRESTRVADILERLDHVLQADELNRMWASALKSPPRRLMLSYPCYRSLTATPLKTASYSFSATCLSSRSLCCRTVILCSTALDPILLTASFWSRTLFI